MARDAVDRPAPALRRRRRTWTLVVVGIVGAVGVALAALIWLFQINPFLRTSVTEAEARAYLDRAVRAGLARDFRALCRLNGSSFNCETDLEAGARATVPTTSPESVDAHFAEADNGDDTSGWVLVVRGRDGRGAPYDTQVMVFRDHEGHLKAINVVWWSGNRLDLGRGEVVPPVR